MGFRPRRGKLAPRLALVGAAVLAIAISAAVACGGGGGGGGPSATATNWEVDQQTLESLEQSASKIEEAFRSGDVDTVISLTHPALRSTYQPIFEDHQAELERVADLLATRTLTDITYSMAEYEVTENGETFYVAFEPWGDQWYLSSL
jgi:hypothetical protein